MPQLGISVASSALRRFWTMLTHYHAQIWKGSELARSLGASEPTMRKYLDLLSSTFMVRQLAPWHENLGKRQVKAPKVYLRDSGLLHCLMRQTSFADLEAHPKLGASWEGFALEQVLSITGDRDAYFWATHGGAVKWSPTVGPISGRIKLCFGVWKSLAKPPVPALPKRSHRPAGASSP
jgi:predicted AAA+ superfamily ATPase